MRSSISLATALAVTAQAGYDTRTFTVLRFFGDAPLTEGRIDPIVSPGQTSGHVHTIMGGSNIGVSATGDSLMESGCSNAYVQGDKSAYWVPKLYFRNTNGSLEPVDLFYFNVYYFFDDTDDKISPFPVGLQINSGDASLRKCPNFGGQLQINSGGNSASEGIQPTQWTCPRSNYQPPSWASEAESDGSLKGIQDPSNAQSGQGFPDANCDGYASPLRMDLHFPSCYDAAASSLTDYQHNMAWPSVGSDSLKQNCPAGYLHVPHLFFEAYWNTPAFQDRWTPFQDQQPFVLSTGDTSGCSAHGDFLAAWDTSVLQTIIDTCNTGDDGMDKCPGVAVRDASKACEVSSPIQEQVHGQLAALPGDNPLSGFGKHATNLYVEELKDDSSSGAMAKTVPTILIGLAVLLTAYEIAMTIA